MAEIDASELAFADAILRFQTGAQASGEELQATASGLFPRPGDSENIIAQKELRRSEYQKAIDAQTQAEPQTLQQHQMHQIKAQMQAATNGSVWGAMRKNERSGAERDYDMRSGAERDYDEDQHLSGAERAFLREGR